MAVEPPVLTVAIGSYPHTAALRSGAVGSDRVRLDFADIKPVNRAFAPMVRENRFDISEMAIATFLQAKAYGKPLVLLPVVLAARFQEAALLCRADSDIAGPADLAGRRVGVRAYSQTTGMWIRGIMADEHGLPADEVAWVTFEGAHVAEYEDPPWCRRALPGEDMLAMLREGDLDAIVVGNDVPDDPGLRSVFPDPAAAGAAFARKHGFVPVNHLLTARADLVESRPELVTEVLRMVKASADLAPAGAFPVCVTPATLEPALALALRYAAEQALLPSSLSLDQVWLGSPPVAAPGAIAG